MCFAGSVHVSCANIPLAKAGHSETQKGLQSFGSEVYRYRETIQWGFNIPNIISLFASTLAVSISAVSLFIVLLQAKQENRPTQTLPSYLSALVFNVW